MLVQIHVVLYYVINSTRDTSQRCGKLRVFCFEVKMSITLKPPKTFSEQIQILKMRSLIIQDNRMEDAIEFLRNNNYYRFSAYYKPYYVIEKNVIQEIFMPETSFDDIKNLYSFDSDFRKILTPLLESIEISFRTHIAYYLAHRSGSLGYLDSGCFKNNEAHDNLTEIIRGVTRNPKEKFLLHHKVKYDDKYPVWVIIECLSLGNLSKLYSNLTTECKKEMCSEFYNNRHQKQIKNWMQGITIIRNISAHHGRLFNRDILVPDLDNITCHPIPGREKRIFSWLLVIKELAPNNDAWQSFLKGLDTIIEKYSFNRFANMGFPNNWKEFL